jgi:histone H2B
MVPSPSKTPTAAKSVKKEKKAEKKEKDTIHGSFSVHTHKALRQVHQDTGIQKINGHHELFHQRCLRKNCLRSLQTSQTQKKHTLSAREIQSAVKLLLPGESAKHDIIEGIFDCVAPKKN